MTERMSIVFLTAAVLAVPVTAAAQNSGEVTFTVPVNLTQLSSGVSKVRVMCSIISEAITVNRQPVSKGVTIEAGTIAAQQEFPVTGGEVHATATVVVSTTGVLDNPLGKTATYICGLDGFSVAQQRFMPFNYALPIEGTEPALRLTVPGSQPAPLRLGGTFTW